MAQFLDLFGFLSVLLRGCTLVFESLLVGGALFSFLFGRLIEERQSLWIRRALIWAAGGLILIQALYSGANAALLSETTGLSWAEVSGAQFFYAGILAVTAGVVMLLLAPRVRWGSPMLLLPALLATGGSLMTSHAAGRLENGSALLAITGLHHLATSAWIGGLPYLWLALRQIQKEPGAVELARGFSRLATVSVAVLGGTGIALSYFYIGSVEAAYGSTYGLMVGAKVALFAALLLLGLSNHQLVKRLHEGAAVLLLRLRTVAEAEIGIGLTVVLAAASLTSMPPAADLPEGWVTLTEIAERLSPRMPRFETPPVGDLSPATPLDVDPNTTPLYSYVPGENPAKKDTPADIAWSEYNHHWAGYVVITAGLLALLASAGIRWARHWPLAFIGLAIFLFLRADSENWPLGPRGFWESFAVAEVAQHRLFVVLIMAFAVFEWAVRNNRISKPFAAYVFPGVCALGGALLLTHTHSLGNLKEEMLVEMSHIPLALFGVGAGWSRWIELRSDDARARLLRFVWPVCLIIVGLVLVLYREA